MPPLRPLGVVDPAVPGHVGAVLGQLDERRHLVQDCGRVRLLSLIAAADGGEGCICDLTAPVGLAQPTVSHHMKQLAEARLVTREQRGKWAYYRVVPALLALSETLRAPAD